MPKAKGALIKELEGEMEKMAPSQITCLLDIAKILKKESKLTAKGIQEILMERKLVTIHPKAKAGSYNPVPIKGKPVSEIILEDRF